MPLRNVSCSYYNGALVLTGRVSSYYQKQIAQTLVAALDGVNRIINNLEVIPPLPRMDWPEA
jgi:osmotically-inducible protein OsmY